MNRILFLKIASLLVFITFLIYGNSLFNHFVWDDHSLIERTPYIKDFKYIKKIFSSDVGMVMHYHGSMGHYRPISLLSFMIDYKIWRLNPFGYHITNIVIHSLNLILLFLLFYYVCKEIKLSLISVLIFALHPIHTEAVTPIFNRMGLLASFFTLISFIFYIKSNQLRKVYYLFFSAIFFLLSLLSKETGIILVLILIIYDYYFIANYNMKVLFRRIYFYLPYFLIILFYLLLRKNFIVAEKALGIWSIPAFSSISFGLQILTTFQIIALYIKLLFFPINLSAMYLLTTAQFNFISFFYGIVINGLIILAYFLRRKNKSISFFIAFFFVTILPFCLVIPFGIRFQERFLYLPSVAFCFIFGNFLKTVISKPNKRFLEVVNFRAFVKIVLIIILLFYGYQTIIRNYDWRTDFLIWKDTVTRCPYCVRAHNNLAYAYKDKGEYKKALEEFNISLSLNPNAFKAYQGIGLVFLETGEFKKSFIYLRKAKYLRPEDASIYNNIGIVYANLGDFNMALTSFKKAIKIWNEFPEPYYNLGMLYYNRNELDKAKAYFEKAVDLNPDNQQFINRLDIVNQQILN
jgi:tetratricopeptide (TPR) repeat protein